MNTQKSLTYYIHVGFYRFISEMAKFFFKDNVLRKELFLKRIIFYFIISILFYWFYSHLEYVFLEHEGPLTYLQKHDRNKILKHILACYVVYTIYFLVSLIIVQLYKFVQTAKVTLFALVIGPSFFEHELFWALEYDYFSYTTIKLALFFYGFLLFGVVFTEFGINLEEEYDDARLRNSEIARSRGTTIQVEDWYDEQDIDEKTSKEFRKMQWQMSHTTKTQALLTDVFGNNDDLGETPAQLSERYKLHKRKMYPEFYEKKSDEEISYDFLQREFDESPETIPEVYLWIFKDEKLKRHFYFNKVAPFLKKYDVYPSFFITIYFIFSLRLFFFRPKVVGLYSFYHPKYAFHAKWIKKSFSDLIFYKRIYQLFLQFWVQLFFKFSFFRLLNNRKWTKFHLKYYTRLIRLRRRRSGNYNFFKSK